MIDTAAKRARALNAAIVHTYATGAVPAGTTDRAFALHLYFAEAGGGVSTSGTRQNRRVAARRRRRC